MCYRCVTCVSIARGSPLYSGAGPTAGHAGGAHRGDDLRIRELLRAATVVSRSSEFRAYSSLDVRGSPAGIAPYRPLG